MKEIRLLKNARIVVGSSPVSLDEAITTHKQVLRNSQEVMSSALTVEKHMEHVISFFLFGRDMSKREFFESAILTSDWCGFSAKRKVVMSILNESKILEGKEKANFDLSMSKIMKYRNAFAHGEITQSQGAIFLKYFEGQARQKELTDDYWTQLEADFMDAHERAAGLLDKLGALNAAEQGAPPDSGDATRPLRG